MNQPARSVIGRVLDVVEAFEHAEWQVSLAELTRRTGLPKATVHRIAGDLVEHGVLERCENGYRLGMRLFVLGERVPHQFSLRAMAVPYLEDLYEATHENVNLGVLHGREVLYLARVQGHRSSDVVLRVGDTLPAHSTSIGKAILAHAAPEVVHDVLQAGLTRLTPRTVTMPGMFLQQLRGAAERGYAVNDEETHVGVVSVAAPVLDARGAAIAAISVTGRAGRVDPHRLAPAIRTATLSLGRRLASSGAPYDEAGAGPS
ncbi:IclR family transcriptional regulator [Nocardioides mangrovicus]|uniref:IclR family transcriptional regulator n=1 Tax=Nocardioides mangrovicus TaxID=2478913 RepID=A0A3L8NYB6_9ACTN|nr:IclR family transcriptional regulator [Nocardioides mangrovicus]RLV47692.1 IclR family transcriptional regulator [Nocardioides mangrovicus]